MGRSQITLEKQVKSYPAHSAKTAVATKIKQIKYNKPLIKNEPNPTSSPTLELTTITDLPQSPPIIVTTISTLLL